MAIFILLNWEVYAPTQSLIETSTGFCVGNSILLKQLQFFQGFKNVAVVNQIEFV